MQECSVTVRLGGSLNHTVPKPSVTPAEIQVLRAIHGVDAVVDITYTRTNKRDHAEEFQRLASTYGSGVLVEPGKEGGNLVSRLFPGANPRLPVKLSEIGLGHLVTKGGLPVVAAVAAPPEIITDPAEDEEEDEDV